MMEDLIQHAIKTWGKTPQPDNRYLDEKSFAREFKTIHLNIGRRMGKSAAIAFFYIVCAVHWCGFEPTMESESGNLYCYCIACCIHALGIY